jgi:hypothetical protein
MKFIVEVADNLIEQFYSNVEGSTPAEAAAEDIHDAVVTESTMDVAWDDVKVEVQK